MINRTIISIFLLVAILPSCIAQGRFEFTPAIRIAYDKTTSLKLEEARTMIDVIKTDDPTNLSIYHIENYIDFFTIFINEDKKEFDQLEKNKDKRISKIKKGNQNSPYYLYSQAEIKLQWALVRLKFEEYFSALLEIKSAYKLLEKNQRKFPDFIANKKSLAIMHAMIGTVPEKYRWGVKFLSGMDGTIQQGQRELEEVIDYAQQTDFIFEQEALVLYAFLMLHLNNNSEEAWNVIRKGNLNADQNPLACFALANLSMKTGKNDEAMELLLNRPKGSEFHPFHYLDYMLGLTKLRRLDADADIYIKKYVDNFEGQNYIKEAYQKLGWHALINNDLESYYKFMRDVKSKGHKMVAADEMALKEARGNKAPEIKLLKARLLFDGAYYNQGYDLLRNLSHSEFTDLKHQLEFYYRLGRITHKMGRLEDAIDFYQTTIDKGANQSFFYACNAALQMGKIYEGLNDFSKSKSYYKKCLSLDPDLYKAGLHQQAKAGLGRIR